MEKERILIVEDDPTWISNYKRWLKKSNPEIHIDDVDNAEKALESLSQNYYAIVILDLALNPEADDDRQSEEVQKFVKNRSEGTKHIIVSTHANKLDTQKAAYTYTAYRLFFKEQFADLSPFLETVRKALQDSKKDRPDFLKNAYDYFIGDENREIIEHKILVDFKPEGGITGWFSFREKFFERVSPICQHKSKKNIKITNEYMAGLFWSRSLGKAISIFIGGKSFDANKAETVAADWLGWPHSKPVMIESKGIKGYYFIEEDLSAADFEL